MDDERIVSMFFDRSEDAVGELDKKYGTMLRQMSKNIVGDAADAEECVNDAYLAVWDAIPPAKPDSLRAFAGKILRNLSLKRYRYNNAGKRGGHHAAAIDELCEVIPCAASAEEMAEAAEISRVIDRFLGTLDAENRVLFVRRYWYCDSIADAAKMLGISEGAAKMRLSRTREKLKKTLEKEGISV